MKSLLLLCSLLLLACENDHPTIKIIEINKKMVLEEWPDSNYIASLDSILKLEPIKKGKDSADVKLKMNAFKAPTFQLPPSVTGSKNTKKPSANKQGKPAKPGKPSSEVAKPSNNAENFIGKFTNALAALQSDPSNKSLYKVVTVNEGEDLFKLLRRTYGAGTQNLPRFYVLSALQSVNAGVMLEHLNAGDKVRVPKL
ncbi:MAG: hypothetical protein IJM92_02265 [Fibrobacter sp.]|uniref:hypothetical protein n=1 Tax=Fibrobacter sp. TaxID=35828 RepID=UPI0025C10687|nr:hypothetical protein [Fibrobacter sp.]MBQ7078496.1 hypothetical protein [Fibrobacter sp.]